ncbi:hypothetical protein H5T53_02275 [Candidatus Bipolaricaulota bacterium]|nr:hypothetical protein [Candidatus Bipolaricaulota bacterium]
MDGEDYFRVDPAFDGNEAFRELTRALHTRGMRIVLDGVFNHCGTGHGDRPQAEPKPNVEYLPP